MQKQTQEFSKLNISSRPLSQIHTNKHKRRKAKLYSLGSKKPRFRFSTDLTKNCSFRFRYSFRHSTNNNQTLNLTLTLTR